MFHLTSRQEFFCLSRIQQCHFTCLAKPCLVSVWTSHTGHCLKSDIFYLRISCGKKVELVSPHTFIDGGN